MLRIVLRAVVAVAVLWLVGAYLARSLPNTGYRAAATTASLFAPRGQVATTGERVLVVDADLLGHYTLHPIVDNRSVTMLVDTGASLVALTSEDALAAGFRPSPADFRRRVSTANGSVGVAPVRIREMRINDIVVRDVDAVVMPPGVLGQSLLGMSFLRRLSGFEMSRGQLTLRG